MQSNSIYGQLAPLFEYPGEDYHFRASECLDRMKLQPGSTPGDPQPPSTRLLEEFCAAIESLSIDELQELFTRTFDLNPACTLEIGWHLYGEEYQRGEFLVKMRYQLRERGIEESAELPDHLTHALQLLDRMEPGEASEFGSHCLLPALDKMRAGWRKDHNAFWSLLESAFALLQSRYPYQPDPRPARSPELRVLQ
jgi:nitrate reductase molybdenum cofactor assembly chaperone NarJ/NarW